MLDPCHARNPNGCAIPRLPSDGWPDRNFREVEKMSGVDWLRSARECDRQAGDILEVRDIQRPEHGVP